METSDTSWAHGFLTGLFVGGASAAALMLLYAPSSGREARRYLSNLGRDGRNRALDVVDRGKQVISEGREALDRGAWRLSTAIAEGREVYRQTKTRGAV